MKVEPTRTLMAVEQFSAPSGGSQRLQLAAEILAPLNGKQMCSVLGIDVLFWTVQQPQVDCVGRL